MRETAWSAGGPGAVDGGVDDLVTGAVHGVQFSFHPAGRGDSRGCRDGVGDPGGEGSSTPAEVAGPFERGTGDE